jgi:hypothetical protein
MRVALLFLFGAITLSFFDGFHTHSHTTSYPAPVVLQMAWWVPLLFGSVVAFGGYGYALLHRALGGSREIPSAARLASAFAVFGALYFASGYLPVSNVLKLVVLSIGAALLWWFLDRSGVGIVLMLVNGLGGALAEMTLVHVGAFAHLQPDILGIPIWLPGLYFAAAPVIGHIARYVLLSERWATSEAARAGA